MMDSNTDLDHLGDVNYKLVGKYVQLHSINIINLAKYSIFT